MKRAIICGESRYDLERRVGVEKLEAIESVADYYEMSYRITSSNEVVFEDLESGQDFYFDLDEISGEGTNSYIEFLMNQIELEL